MAEVAELRTDCVEVVGGDRLLIWDNRKGRRKNRRLPIDTETADAVARWLRVRERIALPGGAEPFLFPPASERGIVRHRSTGRATGDR